MNTARPHARRTAALAVLVGVAATVTTVSSAPARAGNAALTPIQHVVILLAENHTFDNVFATYQPVVPTETVANLRSAGIVTATGDPGPNFATAAQLTANDTTDDPGTYTLTPRITGSFPVMPQPNTGTVPTACDGQSMGVKDKRFPTNLPNGPYPITRYVPYFDDHAAYGGGCKFVGAYVADAQHRFFQMWQQSHTGDSKLYHWVAITAGADNGATTISRPAPGGVSMGFYNMAGGDAPVLRGLADSYAMSDNYHQAVQGGSMVNHLVLGAGVPAYYQDSAGNATVPPSTQIENPNPKPGSNNNYTQDGFKGGSYVNCADATQPGVAPIRSYLASLPYPAFEQCAPDRYYAVNNYLPGYRMDGSLATGTYVVPPQRNWPTIADQLTAANVSWAYYGKGFNAADPSGGMCGICDPFQYSATVMTSKTERAKVRKGSTDFDNDVARGYLPAVSYLKPADDDGHAATSTLAAVEAFINDKVNRVKASPLWASTAIFVLFDEGGGYYDSGYIQPVSFFGDGPRVPFLVVSPYAVPGHIDHTYADHVSVLKFIEANWGLHPITATSTDNLPNPTDASYVPANRPAIGDLMTMFDFTRGAVVSR